MYVHVKIENKRSKRKRRKANLYGWGLDVLRMSFVSGYTLYTTWDRVILIFSSSVVCLEL